MRHTMPPSWSSLLAHRRGCAPPWALGWGLVLATGGDGLVEQERIGTHTEFLRDGNNPRGARVLDEVPSPDFSPGGEPRVESIDGEH